MTMAHCAYVIRTFHNLYVIPLNDKQQQKEKFFDANLLKMLRLCLCVCVCEFAYFCLTAEKRFLLLTKRLFRRAFIQTEKKKKKTH